MDFTDLGPAMAESALRDANKRNEQRILNLEKQVDKLISNQEGLVKAFNTLLDKMHQAALNATHSPNP